MELCRETLANIIDVFEDFLESKGVEIDNPDKTGEEGEAILYGEDFDNLMSSVSGVLKASGVNIAETFDEPYTDNLADVLTIYVPSKRNIIRITIGTGDNLLKEDIRNGYIAYLNYDVYDATDCYSDLGDSVYGGMVLLKKEVDELYNSLSETVPGILKDAYDDIGEVTYLTLAGGKKFKTAM